MNPSHMTRRHMRQMIDTPLNMSEAVRQRGRCLLTPRCSLEIVRPCCSVALRTSSQFLITCDSVCSFVKGVFDCKLNVIYWTWVFSVHHFYIIKISHSVHIVLHCYTLHTCIWWYNITTETICTFPFPSWHRIHQRDPNSTLWGEGSTRLDSRSQSEVGGWKQGTWESHQMGVAVIVQRQFLLLQKVGKEIWFVLCVIRNWLSFNFHTYHYFLPSISWEYRKSISIRLIPLRQN